MILRSDSDLVPLRRHRRSLRLAQKRVLSPDSNLESPEVLRNVLRLFFLDSPRRDNVPPASPSISPQGSGVLAEGVGASPLPPSSISLPCKFEFDPRPGGGIPPDQGPPATMGLVRERLNLNANGLPDNLIRTIQGARAHSTRFLYDLKWAVFSRCYDQRSKICSFQMFDTDGTVFPAGLIMESGKVFSTILVYLSAISVCRVGFGSNTLGSHPLVCCFMNGANLSSAGGFVRNRP